jgi:large subunit ribosomal protein L9
MKVILKQEVDNLGLAGDVVDVANGYGRNFLLPRGMAILATRGAMREAEALTRSRKAVEAKTLDSAMASKDAIEGRTLEIKARVDERGHLYGSVGVNDIHRVLRERGHQIEKKRIDLRGTIKEIGTYEVPVQVHPQVEALVTIDVLDEEGQVIAGQIAAPEPPPPLLGQEPEAEPAEAEAEAEGEVETLEDAAAAQDAAEEPKIDSVEALVEQALEAADQYETEHADEDEDADEASTADADEATGA